MQNKDYEELRRIAELEVNDQYLGCPAELVQKLQIVLNVAIPDIYRYYLEHYNGGSFYDYAFTLFSIPTEYNNVPVEESLGFNNMPGAYEELSIPKNYLKIGTYCFGDVICLDPDTGHIVQWDVENDSVYLEYMDFLDFLTEAESDSLQG